MSHIPWSIGLDTYVITGVWAGIAQGEGKLCSFYTYYLELWAVVSLFNCTFLNWTRQINHWANLPLIFHSRDTLYLSIYLKNSNTRSIPYCYITMFGVGNWLIGWRVFLSQIPSSWLRPWHYKMCNIFIFVNIENIFFWKGIMKKFNTGKIYLCVVRMQSCIHLRQVELC